MAGVAQKQTGYVQFGLVVSHSNSSYTQKFTKKETLDEVAKLRYAIITLLNYLFTNCPFLAILTFKHHEASVSL
jgi:hypothetical protein